jgi:hypothetical protein
MEQAMTHSDYKRGMLRRIGAYRYEHSLLFAVKRASGGYRPEIYETGVNREDLCKLQRVAELQAL